jgi:TPP-dependent pyruvate/acetoin dehydrogenase alpha subunit
MAGKELPRIRSGMQDLAAPVVEVWSDDDHRRATSLGTILSPDGKADRAGVPALAPEALRECYRTMLRIRALGERAAERAGPDQGAAGPDARGAEAAIVGAVSALEADDVVVPGWREGGAALWRGHTVAALAAGTPAPRALAVLPPTPYRGTQLPHATGIAWAIKLQAKQQANLQSALQAATGGGGKVVLAYLDQGATSTEDFHAGLNFAGVFGVPAVFVCINDASRASVETVSETLAVKALAYGLSATRVDGNDLFAVHAATRAAADRARRGEGATLIEAVLAEAGDPLERVRGWLASQNIADAAAEAALRREVGAEVDAAFGKP